MKFLFYIILSIFLSSCSSTKESTKKELRRLVKIDQFSKAKELAESKNYYSDKESILLKQLEIGILEFYLGNYKKSTEVFSKAKEISDKLFTVSISKKIKAALLNNNSDNYYGEKYERSLIRFYLSMSFYMLYQRGYEYVDVVDEKTKKTTQNKIELERKNRLNYLQMARAQLLEWDSLLASYKGELLGESVYKNDLLAKFYGAFIHAELGSSSERQIARGLLKKIDEILIKNYSAYESFNELNKKYKENYKKFPKMGAKKVEKEFIKKTFEYKNTIELKKALKKDLKKKSGILVLFQEDIIAKKVSDKIKFKLPITSMSVSVGKTRGLMGPIAFAVSVLGIASAADAAIEYEIPKFVAQAPSKPKYLVVRDELGKEILREPIGLLNPMSELAKESFEQQVNSMKAKIAARVTTKYVTAIVAAYTTYVTAAKSGGIGAMTAYPLGLAAYMASSKGIANSEKADTRYWSLLPSRISASYVKLKPGKYDFFIETKISDKNTSLTKLKNILVDEKTRLIPLKF